MLLIALLSCQSPPAPPLSDSGPPLPVEPDDAGDVPQWVVDVASEAEVIWVDAHGAPAGAGTWVLWWSRDGHGYALDHETGQIEAWSWPPSPVHYAEPECGGAAYLPRRSPGLPLQLWTGAWVARRADSLPAEPVADLGCLASMRSAVGCREVAALPSGLCPLTGQWVPLEEWATVQAPPTDTGLVGPLRPVRRGAAR